MIFFRRTKSFARPQKMDEMPLNAEDRKRSCTRMYSEARTGGVKRQIAIL